MAEQDVQVKEIDVIRVYNQKFGEFSVSFSEQMHQLLHALQEKLETLQQVKQDIIREREIIDNEIREARQKYHDSHNCGSYETAFRPDGTSYSYFVPDYDYIRQCREEFEHLSGPIYHNAQNCEDLAHNRLMQATQIINMVEYRTNNIVSTFQNYVGRGKQYLDKVAQYIDQYKENNPNI